MPEESKAWMAELAEYPIVPVAFMETHLQGTAWASKGQPTAQWNFSPGALTKYIHLSKYHPSRLLRQDPTTHHYPLSYRIAAGELDWRKYRHQILWSYGHECHARCAR